VGRDDPRESPAASGSHGAAVPITAPAYQRRRPEEGVLHAEVRAELRSFLAAAQARGRPVPGFVERELEAFLRCVFGLLRGRARARGLSADVQCGAVTFIQRFGDGLHLNVHFHSLVLDGVYAIGRDGRARFHALPPPTDEAIAGLVLTLARRIARLLEKRGPGSRADPEEADPLARDEPLLASLYGASIASRIATGPRAGRRVERQGDRIDVDVLPRLSGPRCASAAGVSLQRPAWADLLRRVFAIDVLACPRCPSRLRILSVIHSPSAARAILESLGLPARAPPTDPARRDPELEPSEVGDPFPPGSMNPTSHNGHAVALSTAYP
jgi:hypothetical protein